MNRHASMNRIFRLVWNESLNAYVPAAETTRGRGKNGRRKLFAAALTLAANIAQAGPTGGQVTAGSGAITQSGSTTTIQQASQDLSLNWKSFNTAAQETVDFVQPNASAVAVNRILDPNGSVILGHLNANGQVYLINPNGVLFGRGAEVNVGGLVASTLDLNDGTLGNASKTFNGAGTGSVVNDGTLTATPGGVIALLGNRVSNNGVVSAQLGTVAIGAGSAATLTFRGTSLVSMQIDQSVLNSAASNGGLVQADGGRVLMTAGARKSLLASVVNNTGVIEARTLENHEGAITLLGGSGNGAVNESGTLDVSARQGGNGGTIDTSGAYVKIADSARITSAAAMGLTGTWSIDPTDFTISAGSTAQSASGIGATTLQNELAGTNVAIATSASGSQNGDINVNAPLSWSVNTLSLSAANNIKVNAVMTVSGAAKVDLEPGANGALSMGFAADGTFAGRVDISSSAPNALTIGGQVFTVINTLGMSGSMTGTDLQGINGNLNGHFALGSNIDATATSGWNGGQGFTTIGSITVDPNNGSIIATVPFTGVFDGLGHTISNLTIYQPSTEGDGLFAVTSTATKLSNVGLLAGNVTGTQSVGLLVGKNLGSISNSYATGNSTALEYNDGVPCAGGLVGRNLGAISYSHASVAVVGTANVGGLVGANDGTIANSDAAGSVHGGTQRGVGGLVGANYGGSIDNSFAAGSVSNDAGGIDIGGLVGYNTGVLSNSFYNADQVSINGSHELTAGGLYNAQYLDWSSHGETLDIANYAASLPVGSGGYYNVGTAQSFADLLGFSENNAANDFRMTANVSLPAGLYLPYFVGSFDGAGHTIANLYVNIPSNDNIGLFAALSGVTSISNVHVSNGYVNGHDNVGGLAGLFSGTSLSGSSFSGSVQGGEYVGGLVGSNSGGIVGSHATGTVSGSSNVGGLAGQNYGSVGTSYASGAVSGSSYVGGLAGRNGNTGSISDSFASGPVTGNNYVNGGLVGTNYGSISNSYASGAVTGVTSSGGLVGTNYGTISNSYASGAVSSGGPVGGLVGSASYGTISNSFYSTTGNQNMSGVGGVADAAGSVLGLSSMQLQVQANFAAATAANGNLNPGWDFANTWILYEGATNPMLRAFMTPLTIGGGITRQTYNGAAFAPGRSGLNYSIAPDTSLLLGTVTVTGTAIHAGNYTYTPGGLYSNQLGYIITYAPTALTIDPAPLTVVGTSVVGKTYDSSTSAALSAGTLAGVIGGDRVTLTQAGSFASKNAGARLAVSAADALGGANASDYTLLEPTGLTGSITPATLTVSGTTVAGKIYDGTTQATLSGGSLTGVIGGDTVALTQAGSFATKNVGTGIAVTANDSLSGASAGNYAIVEPTALSGSIMPAKLTVSGTLVGSKTYDGTLTASITGGTLSGVVTGDTVALTQAGSFATKNVGTGIAVSVNDGLSGASAGDYTLVEPAALSASITPASLTVSGTTVASKTYDGTTTASISGGTLSGVVAGDSVTLTQAGSFASKNVGTGIAVMANDSLSGASAGDYSIAEPTALSGSITPATLTVNGTTVGSRLYDGTDVAPVSGGTLMGLVSGDSVILSQSGNFVSTGPGTRIAITITDSLSGTNAGDYRLSEPMGLSGSILPAPSLPDGSSDPVLAAVHARSQIVENLIYPQLGANAQIINASPTITALSSADDASETAHDSSQATAVNVSMKIGASGTLKIENGGLRLPSNLVAGNE